MGKHAARRAMALLIGIGLLAGSAGCAGADPGRAQAGSKPAGAAVAGAHAYAAGTGCSLWADGTTGEVWIQGAAGERLWTSYPPMEGIYDFATEERRNAVLAVNVVDTYNNQNLLSSYSGSVQRQGLTLEPIADGVEMIFDFPGEGAGFTIPVRFTLRGTRLRAEILFDELYTYGNVTVNTVDLMPYFGAATKEDEGYILVPDGSGALIRFGSANKEADVYTQPLYGRDPALTAENRLETTEAARLPVYGVYKNGRGFAAVADQGECAASVTAGQPGKISVYSSAGFSFTYTQRDSYTIADKDANAQTVYVSAAAPSRVNPVVTYLLLEQGADYVGMAQAVRTYLIETRDLARTTQTQAQLYLAFYGGAEQEKTLLGIPYRQLQVATTFADVQAILGDLTQAGADNLQALLCGFQRKGLFGSSADTLAFDSAFGGTSGFQQLCSYGRDNGIGIYPLLDFADAVGGPASEAARRISGDYLVRGFVQPHSGQAEEQAHWRLRAPAAAREKALRFLEGCDGTYGLYLAGMGDTLYSDYQPRAFVTRDEAKELVRGVLAEAGEPLIVNGGNLYAAPYAAAVLQAPEQASGFIAETDAVPFYALVMHGLCTLAGDPVNEASDPEEAFLRGVSLGYSLHFRLTAESPYVLRKTRLNGLLSSRYSDWKDDIVRMHGRLSALDGLGDRYITAYAREGDLAVTDYEDGTRVYVNFGTEPVTADGHRIPARDFRCVRPGA